MGNQIPKNVSYFSQNILVLSLLFVPILGFNAVDWRALFVPILGFNTVDWRAFAIVGVVELQFP
jgi:hypothetical protein